VSELHRRGRHLELVSIDGNPTEVERAAIEETLEQIVASERAQTRASLWRRASRSHARGLGIYDYRDRFSADDRWRLSTRFPFGGREYSGRAGRGDSR
jgi:hypothetical protein